MTTAHPLEYVLLFVSLAATAQTGFVLVARVRDLLVAQHRYAFGSDKRIISDDRAFDEVFRFSKCVVMLAAAVSSLFLAPPPPPYSELPQTLVLITAMITVGVLLTANSMRCRWTQTRLERLASDRKRNRKVAG